MDDYNLLIKKAIQACIDKNAYNFASLFSEDGEIIFSKNYSIHKKDIESLTKDYFANLKYIKIDVHYIIIEKNKAFIEWSWSDYNLIKNIKNSHDNVIALDFKKSLIYRWREYKSV